MATVAGPRVCPACDREISGDPPFCAAPCFTERPSTGWPTAEPPAGSAGEEPEARAAAETAPTICCPNPTCGGEIAADARRCLYCDTVIPASSSWSLDVAGEKVVIMPGHLILIGRAPESPVAEALADHTNVSRVHCEVRLLDGLEVRDAGSTNHTFLDDRMVGEDWEALPAGSRLRLASDFYIRVDGPGGDG